MRVRGRLAAAAAGSASASARYFARSVPASVIDSRSPARGRVERPSPVLSPLEDPKLPLPTGRCNDLADAALTSVLGGNDGDIPASIVPDEALREALGEARGDALGETLGDGLGDALDDTLGDALGDALGESFGDFVALSSPSPTSRQASEPDSCGG